MAETRGPVAGSAGKAVMRLRGVDAEGVRLGVPPVHFGAEAGLSRNPGAAFREQVFVGSDTGFLRATQGQLRRKVLRAGSAREVPAHARGAGISHVRS